MLVAGSSSFPFRVFRHAPEIPHTCQQQRSLFRRPDAAMPRRLDSTGRWTGKGHVETAEEEQRIAAQPVAPWRPAAKRREDKTGQPGRAVTGKAGLRYASKVMGSSSNMGPKPL